MISLIISLVVLIGGFFLYGRVVEKAFAPDGRPTPAIAINDGVDCIPMKTWKAFLIQFLNIAGTGPIFGALMGALFGPVVFLWIVLGSILGGAVHDYLSGMISLRNGGASLAELTSKYLGKGTKWVIRIITVVLLTLIGSAFTTSPAALLSKLTPEVLSVGFWTIVILAYYCLATLLPIDKLIGKLYPVFGAALLFMAAGIVIGLVFTGSYKIPEITLHNLHPSELPVWPFMFVTVSCGAISGFHATQSPMIARCLKSEKNGRPVFYGAMICEAVIALIWAAAGVGFYGTTEILAQTLTATGQAGAVYEISTGLLGKVGGALAIVGVVACPITTGDTAFRSARLILAECTGLDQKKISKRLLLTLPLLAIGGILTQLDYSILWRYVSWTNQTLAVITLWMATSYLTQNAKHRVYSLITALPATFMTAVCISYILMADEGLRLSAAISYPIGVAGAIISFAYYALRCLRTAAPKAAANG